MTGLHDDLIDAGEQHLSNPNWMPVSRDYLSDVLAALSESDAEVARLRAELAKSDSAFSSLKQQHTAADVDLIDLRDERDELQARINKALPSSRRPSMARSGSPEQSPCVPPCLHLRKEPNSEHYHLPACTPPAAATGLLPGVRQARDPIEDV